MTKHHTEDYKLTAVKYYLDNNTSYKNVCDIFKCSERSLKRWIIRYENDKSIKRYSRKEISYKITKEQVKHAITLLKQNQQITMTELVKLIKNKYKSFDITQQWLGKVLKDNNKTRKRTRHEHFPITRYKKPTNKKEELNKFYKEVSKYKLNNIISLDETSISSAMIAEYSRCTSGKRCVVKTDDSFFFRKFTLLVAIKNSKYIGWILYEKGGMTKERLIEFMDKFIFRNQQEVKIISIFE
jgi:transposase